MGKVARPALEYRLTDTQRDLAEQYWRYALTIASRFGARHSEVAGDWEGAAALGLCAAARTFEPVRQLAFKTLLVPRVRGECHDELCRVLGVRRPSYQKRHPTSLPRLKFVPLEHEPIQTAPPIEWLAEYEENYRNFCTEILRQDVHIPTLAQKLGCSTSWLQRVRTRALPSIRAQLALAGNQ